MSTSFSLALNLVPKFDRCLGCFQGFKNTAKNMAHCEALPFTITDASPYLLEPLFSGEAAASRVRRSPAVAGTGSCGHLQQPREGPGPPLLWHRRPAAPGCWECHSEGVSAVAGLQLTHRHPGRLRWHLRPPLLQLPLLCPHPQCCRRWYNPRLPKCRPPRCPMLRASAPSGPSVGPPLL